MGPTQLYKLGMMEKDLLGHLHLRCSVPAHLGQGQVRQAVEEEDHQLCYVVQDRNSFCYQEMLVSSWE